MQLLFTYPSANLYRRANLTALLGNRMGELLEKTIRVKDSSSNRLLFDQLCNLLSNRSQAAIP